MLVITYNVKTFSNRLKVTEKSGSNEISKILGYAMAYLTKRRVVSVNRFRENLNITKAITNRLLDELSNRNLAIIDKDIIKPISLKKNMAN